MTQDSPGPEDRISTGIPGLDTVLHGGFRRGRTYMVMGMPGAGKTILANQACFHHIRHGQTALYVTLLAESHVEMVSNLHDLSFFDASRIGPGGSLVDVGCGWGAEPPFPRDCGALTPAGWPSAEPAACPASASALSPSPRSMAMGVLTFTPSVPAGIRILPSVPSSTASTSIVALSVSISSRTSPAEKASPGFFFQAAIPPSVMVGDMAGMLNLENSSARRDEWKERCERVDDEDEAAETAFWRPDR